MFRFHLPAIIQEGEEGGFELKSDLDYAVLGEATAVRLDCYARPQRSCCLHETCGGTHVFLRALS